MISELNYNQVKIILSNFKKFLIENKKLEMCKLLEVFEYFLSQNKLYFRDFYNIKIFLKYLLLFLKNKLVHSNLVDIDIRNDMISYNNWLYIKIDSLNNIDIRYLEFERYEIENIILSIINRLDVIETLRLTSNSNYNLEFLKIKDNQLELKKYIRNIKFSNSIFLKEIDKIGAYNNFLKIVRNQIAHHSSLLYLGDRKLGTTNVSIRNYTHEITLSLIFYVIVINEYFFKKSINI